MSSSPDVRENTYDQAARFSVTGHGWGVGLATSYTLGGFIHVLLIVAVIAVLVRVITGRRVV